MWPHGGAMTTGSVPEGMSLADCRRSWGASLEGIVALLAMLWLLRARHARVALLLSQVTRMLRPECAFWQPSGRVSTVVPLGTAVFNWDDASRCALSCVCENNRVYCCRRVWKCPGECAWVLVSLGYRVLDQMQVKRANRGVALHPSLLNKC